MDETTLVVMADALIWGYVLGSLIYLALTSDVMRETGNRFRRWRHRNRPPFLPALFSAEALQALRNPQGTERD